MRHEFGQGRGVAWGEFPWDLFRWVGGGIFRDSGTEEGFMCGRIGFDLSGDRMSIMILRFGQVTGGHMIGFAK